MYFRFSIFSHTLSTTNKPIWHQTIKVSLMIKFLFQISDALINTFLSKFKHLQDKYYILLNTSRVRFPTPQKSSWTEIFAFFSRFSSQSKKQIAISFLRGIFGLFSYSDGSGTEFKKMRGCVRVRVCLITKLFGCFWNYTCIC